MSTVTLSELIDREVVSGSTAESIGEIKSLVLDRQGQRVRRVQVAGSKRSPELVEWRRIESVGSDAVLVRAETDVHDSDDNDDALYTRGEIEIVGARVLDTLGFERGAVTDLHIDAESGDVLAFMTDHGRIPTDRVESLGSYALVVAAN